MTIETAPTLDQQNPSNRYWLKGPNVKRLYFSKSTQVGENISGIHQSRLSLYQTCCKCSKQTHQILALIIRIMMMIIKITIDHPAPKSQIPWGSSYRAPGKSPCDFGRGAAGTRNGLCQHLGRLQFTSKQHGIYGCSRPLFVVQQILNGFDMFDPLPNLVLLITYPIIDPIDFH